MNEASNHSVENDGALESPLSLSERVRSLQLPRRSSSQARGSSWLPWILCVLLAGVAGYFGFLMFQEDKGYQEYLELKKTLDNPLAALANQAKAQPGQGQNKELAPDAIALESKGYIIPISLIQVSPKVGGMVTELYITEGDAVKAGDLLAELEDIDYKSDRDRALATLNELRNYRDQEEEQAKAEWEDSKAQRDQLFLDYKRSLVLKDSNALPVKDFEQAESAYKSMDYRTRRLKLAYDLMIKGQRDERIAAAKADLEKAQWRLDNTKVRAPLNGIVTSKKAEKYNMVNPAAFSNGLSASLCEMADLSEMEVDLAVAERDIGKVFKNQKCVVRAEAFPDRVYQGKVSRIMPSADRSKGAVPVRVKIDIPRAEAGQYLRPEMGAVVTFYNTKS